MAQNFKKRLLIELSVLLGIILIMGGTLVYFASTIRTKGDAVIEARKILMSRSYAIENFAGLRGDWNQGAKEGLELLRDSVPIKDQLITLGKDFQFLAGRAGLEFSYAPIGETAPAAPSLGSIQFRISVTGPYDVIQKYITTLQGFRYITTVDGVSFARSGTSYEAVITGKTYFR